MKEFARAVAAATAAESDRYVTVMTKAKRTGKIFIDFFRNDRGATAVAPYSTRARPGAPVATPLEWREATPASDPKPFHGRIHATATCADDRRSLGADADLEGNRSARRR